jgi:hypothetical protein
MGLPLQPTLYLSCHRLSSSSKARPAMSLTTTNAVSRLRTPRNEVPLKQSLRHSKLCVGVRSPHSSECGCIEALPVLFLTVRPALHFHTPRSAAHWCRLRQAQGSFRNAKAGASAGSRTRIDGFGGHYTIHCATLALRTSNIQHRTFNVQSLNSHGRPKRAA